MGYADFAIAMTAGFRECGQSKVRTGPILCERLAGERDSG